MALSSLFASASSALTPEGVPNPTVRDSAAAIMQSAEIFTNLRTVVLICWNSILMIDSLKAGVDGYLRGIQAKP